MLKRMTVNEKETSFVFKDGAEEKIQLYRATLSVYIAGNKMQLKAKEFSLHNNFLYNVYATYDGSVIILFYQFSTYKQG